MTYILSYASGNKQVITDSTDCHGRSQCVLNVAYLPKVVTHGPVRSIVLIIALAVLSDGTTAGITTVRFAAQR